MNYSFSDQALGFVSLPAGYSEERYDALHRVLSAVFAVPEDRLKPGEDKERKPLIRWGGKGGSDAGGGSAFFFETEFVWDGAEGRGDYLAAWVAEGTGLSGEAVRAHLRDAYGYDPTFAVYDYCAPDGTVAFRKVRETLTDPARIAAAGRTKEFFIQVPAPDPKRPGREKWVKSTKGTPRPPLLYRECELRAAPPGGTVFVCEGEKDCDNVRALGLVAVSGEHGTRPGGWLPEYSEALDGRSVAVLLDEDDAGRDHAARVAAALHGTAARVRVLPLPDLPAKGDVSDWIAADGTKAELLRLEAEAADYVPPPGQPAGATAGGAASGPATEDGVAAAFADRFAGRLLFDHSSGSWFEWNGAVWAKQETGLAFHWVRTAARDAARSSGNARAVAVMGRAAFAAGTERFARSDPAFAVTATAFDTDPWLLGTPEGTVDLRTGELRPADPRDRITKAAAVGPLPAAGCPAWLRFLDEATSGDAGLIRFLQQWCGYSLTGDTREHALLFVYGPGGNGKSVFMNVVAGILGSYACTSAMETFAAAQGERHPTDLAMLRGARLVTASETEEGQAWAEKRIKQLTGGDAITARFMRQDFFTFLPTFKLTIIGNHKPVLRNVDDAAKRRFNIVPFVHEPPEPDRGLEATLRAEWPGILRWMIEGCLDWQASGLLRPKVVLDATAEYFSDQDVLSQWLEDCCDTNPKLQDTSARLFISWSNYADMRGMSPGSQRALANWLKGKGYRLEKKLPGLQVRGFLGLQVNDDKTRKHTEKPM